MPTGFICTEGLIKPSASMPPNVLNPCSVKDILIGIGTTGENITIRGLVWDQIVPGVCLKLGAVMIEVTEFASPCQSIVGSFADGHSKRISQKVHPSWSRVYGRVLTEGVMRVGDAATVVVRPSRGLKKT